MVDYAPESQAQPVSFEEEALKRNTDCVYFLASPLTCKKGSECEYRHSDIARLNPRDCWYWLNSTCLNPKCAFRHPPLDGLLVTQTPASSGPSVSLPQNVTTSIPQASNVSSKQGVPCVFFQKGHCLKGDWCPFLHVPSPSSNKGLPVPGTGPTTEPSTGKVASSGPQKSVQEKKILPTVTAKSVKNIPQEKATSNVGPTPLRNEFALNNRVQLTSGINEFRGYQVAPSVSNGSPIGLSGHVQQPHLLDEPESLNEKDLDEVSRELSPGFDVLVDDEGRDTDYYPGEERYGMPMEHESRSEFDIGHSNDYNVIAAIDGERYQDALGYDSHDHQKGLYAWEQPRSSSERMSGGSYYDRKAYARSDAFSQIDELDLRHRLGKHKKANGLRSVISHEYSHDMQVGDESYQGVRRDDLRTSIRENSLSSRTSIRENSLSSRLHGRIRLPKRSPSPSERNPTRGTDHGGPSPLRSRASSVQGRIRDRIKGRVEEPFTNDGKNYRGLHRDAIGDMDVEFVGPKSLAELKNKKNGETSVQDVIDQGSLGKRKHLMSDGYQQSGSDLSFEGPKSLQEILKRKRGETNGTTSGRTSSNTEPIIEDKIQEAAKETTKETTGTETTGLSGMKEEIAPSTPIISTLQTDGSKFEAEGPRTVEDGEDQDYEAYEQRDGEYEYEQGDGEDVGLYEENGEAVEEEYVDDEDDDEEFAKKMGVVYS